MDSVPFEPNHLEFFATVTLQKNQHFTTEQVEGWLTRLVHAVGMSELKPAEAISCDDLGNEGISGIVMLKESHSSIHIWDKKPQPYLKIVLYSCKSFATGPILDLFQELGSRVCRWELKERNHPDEKDLLHARMYRVIDEGVRDYR
jgi:S-adenosylmethionine/arginine decarboxylase-like enzyme